MSFNFFQGPSCSRYLLFSSLSRFSNHLIPTCEALLSFLVLRIRTWHSISVSDYRVNLASLSCQSLATTRRELSYTKVSVNKKSTLCSLAVDMSTTTWWSSWSWYRLARLLLLERWQQWFPAFLILDNRMVLLERELVLHWHELRLWQYHPRLMIQYHPHQKNKPTMWTFTRIHWQMLLNICDLKVHGIKLLVNLMLVDTANGLLDQVLW